MNIDVPDILRSHQPTLKQFFDGMVFKLAVNAHKDEITDRDVPGLVQKMLDELDEFRDELRSDRKTGPNALQELFDVGNFAYLLFQFLRNNGVPDPQELFLREYLRADFELGRIYAIQNRSGSRYREGDEILGTFRNGRCYIRVQHANTGASISLPRDHLVWWFAHGKWPSSELKHIDGWPNNDSLANLELCEDSQKEIKFPFVVQWKPKGKENHSHFNKWCYQRRHNGVLVKVGYWDTAEEAAREGLLAWKNRISQTTED